MERRNGKTSELIDTLVSLLYNESNARYAVVVPTRVVAEMIMGVVYTDALVLGATLTHYTNKVFRSKNGIEIRFYLDTELDCLRGITFNDIFFDDPISFIKPEVMRNLIHRIKQ
jgi:hypothetical protein